MDLRPLIIDCDPGVDDAQAIMLLHASNKFSIEGITSVHGNVSLDSTTANAQFLEGYFRIGCPVVRGASEALIKRMPRAEYAHGGNGLAGFEYEPANSEAGFEGHAWDLLHEKAVERDGELEVIAFGPLTNIAIAVLRYPDFAKQVKQLTIMGGGLTVGNISPYAEFNTWQDPHAAQIVLTAGFKKTVIVDLDACYAASMTISEADRLLCLPQTNRIAPLMKAIRGFRLETILDKPMPEYMRDFYGSRFIPCDAVAAAVAAYPEIAKTEAVGLVCEAESPLCTGRTVIDRRGKFGVGKNVEIISSIDREAFVKRYFECIDRYDATIEVRA